MWRATLCAVRLLGCLTVWCEMRHFDVRKKKVILALPLHEQHQTLHSLLHIADQ